jgi:hypothetical protein
MPYVVNKSGSGYKVFKKGTSKSFSKKPMTKEKAQAQQKALYANESLNTRNVGSNLEFKSVIPTADKTEATVFYRIKKEPGADLALVFKLGETPEETDYLYGAVIDRNDPRGRAKRFEDPSLEETIKMLSIYELTSEDVEMAGQDAYEKIAHDMTSRPSLNEPYEEGLEFETFCSKILSE